MGSPAPRNGRRKRRRRLHRTEDRSDSPQSVLGRQEGVWAEPDRGAVTVRTGWRISRPQWKLNVEAAIMQLQLDKVVEGIQRQMFRLVLADSQGKTFFLWVIVKDVSKHAFMGFTVGHAP